MSSFFSRLFNPAPVEPRPEDRYAVGVVLMKADLHALPLLLAQGGAETTLKAILDQAEHQQNVGLLGPVQKAYDAVRERLEVIASMPDDTTPN